MEDLNLHFTGDFHAIAAANNMLAAFVDRHIFYGNELQDRPAPRHLAPGGRHERPPPAQHHHRPRRPHARHPARDRLRHRGRLRGDGDHGHGHLAAGPAQADRRDHGRLRRRRRAGHGRADGLRRRHDGAAEGRAEAQPDPDAGGPALLHAHRAVRQHRPRQQLDRGRPGRPQAGRLPDHRGRLRQRPGHGEVHGHRLPRGRVRAQRGRDRGHRQGAQAPRRARGRSPQLGRRQPAGDRGGLGRTWPATSSTPRSSACPAWSPPTASPATPTRRSRWCRSWRSITAPTRRC